MSVRVFMKRLAEVEINPRLSNQHEFNAGVLRRELGFEADPTRGHVEFLFYKTDGGEPVVVRESYTLYDAGGTNRNVPSGDVLHQPWCGGARPCLMTSCFSSDRNSSSTDLIAVVARKGTAVERALVKQLAGCEPEELGDRLFVDSRNVDADTCRLLLRSLEGSGFAT